MSHGACAGALEDPRLPTRTEARGHEKLPHRLVHRSTADRDAPDAPKVVCALRRWVLQAEVDGAQRPGAISAEQQRIKDLERES
jgi:hypothetical protein